MKKYCRNKGCYGKVVKVLENGMGIILELDNGEEAFCSKNNKELYEGSVVLGVVKKSAYKGRRMIIEILEIICCEPLGNEHIFVV